MQKTKQSSYQSMSQSHIFIHETIMPRGMLSLPVTWSDGTHERTEICDFMVLPTTSNHDILLGREGIARFNANASTAHAMVGFPTKTGVAFIRGNRSEERRVGK